MHHGMTFNFGSAKVCSPAIFETSFSHDKDTWIAETDYYYALLHKCTISIDSYSPINKFYSFKIFSLLINAVILPVELSSYPTALGVLFSHMVSGWVGGLVAGKSLSGLYLRNREV